MVIAKIPLLYNNQTVDAGNQKRGRTGGGGEAKSKGRRMMTGIILSNNNTIPPIGEERRRTRHLCLRHLCRGLHIRQEQE